MWNAHFIFEEVVNKVGVDPNHTDTRSELYEPIDVVEGIRPCRGLFSEVGHFRDESSALV